MYADLKDEPLSGVLHATTAAQVWTKLIGELFCGTLSDDSLIAIAMVISLPSSYATLRTILMSTDDKLSVDAVISQVSKNVAKRLGTSKKIAVGRRLMKLQLFLANTLDTALDKHWIVDSGATARAVRIGNGSTVLTTATGCITLEVHLAGGTTGRVALQTVYYVPSLRIRNLLLDRQQQNQSHPANILYQTPGNPNSETDIPACAVSKNMATGKAVTSNKRYSDAACSPCLEGKQYRKAIPSTTLASSPDTSHQDNSTTRRSMESNTRLGQHLPTVPERLAQTPGKVGAWP